MLCIGVMDHKSYRYSHSYNVGCLLTCFGLIYLFITAVATSLLVQQIGSDINGQVREDQFGWSVSMSADGTTFVVGARRHDGTGSGADAGSSDTVNRYAQFGFDIDGKITRDFFRFSVSLSADATTFIVGAPYNDANSTDVDVNSNFWTCSSI